jgi:HPt (histidine-containing phosphotransfer) domain-containing protein
MADDWQQADELKRLLARDIFTRMAEIKAASARDDFDTIRREAHKLAGAAGYCGDTELEHCARELLREVERSADTPGDRAVHVDALDAAAQKYRAFQSEADNQ